MRSWLILVLTWWAAAASAADYCVGTMAGFKQAIINARNDGAPSVIKVRQGVYVLDESVVYSAGGSITEGSLTLSGGYVGADCLIQQATPVGTTIGGTSVALSISNSIGLKVENLTFLGLDLNLTACSQANFFNCDLLIRRIRGQTQRTNVILNNGIGILRDSLFTTGRNGIALSVEMVEPLGIVVNGTMFLTNVSVVDALTRFTGNNPSAAERHDVDIRNSAFVNAGADIETNRDLSLRFSRYDTIDVNQGAAVLVANNVGGAPNWNAQFVPNAGSPLLDNGTGSVEGGLTIDVYGEPRVVGAGVDIGAAESPVDGSGVFVVTTTATSGSGSLSEAVGFANADPAANLIRFDIPGSCPKRIARSTALVVTDGLTFDGYSQPGSSVNTGTLLFNGEPCIILSGNNRTHDGIEAGAALTTKNEGVRVRGLAFEGFDTALDLDQGISHIVIGNQFGGTIDAPSGPDTVLLGNERAIALNRDAQQFATIGTPNAADRNLIVGSDATAISIESSNNTLTNNQIGFDNLGSSSSGFSNLIGVSIFGGNNLLVNNDFGGQTFDAVRISGANARLNRVQSNQFGGTRLGPNGLSGVVLMSNAHRNRVGPGNEFVGNRTAVRVSASAGGRNRIDGNSMVDQVVLGIDLGDAGVTPNSTDPQICDVDLGCPSNGEQNYPVLTAARIGGVAPIGRPLSVSGSLRSLVRSEPYLIEFFASDRCHPSGHGEGSRSLDSIELTVVNTGLCLAGNCTASFSTFIAADDVVPNEFLSATATSPSGDTSEFSSCELISGNDEIFRTGFE